ncbi:saccharopine dehydrogenase C-terminal domain-containing protein [Chloroflexota bacterium]
MAEQFKYAVVGAGRQGTAAAYDMVLHGGASSVLLADYDGAVARQAAERINRLVGREVASHAQLDVRDYDALVTLLEPIDVYLCAVPYKFIMGCTQAAIHAKTHMVDLGGHTDTVLKQMQLDEVAKERGISIVPDCGMGPGLNNTMGLYTVEQLAARGAAPREVRIWDGGLPVDPPPPWGYQASFHINGLTNEYSGKAVFLRDGKITLVETFTEFEILEFEGLGKLEAFVASGGTSTVPYNYEGQLQVYENKICRYPGHFAQFRAFKDLGLFNEEPVDVIPGKVRISPREFYHALLGPQIEVDQVVDICVMRAEGIGSLDGQDIAMVIDIVDGFDEPTGFNGMERLTGWHAAIMCEFIARGEVEPGAWAMEKAVTSTRFMEKIRERGFKVTERWEA